MILKQPYGENPRSLHWEYQRQQLLDLRDWGYVTKEGMVVLTTTFDRHPERQRAVERELDVVVFNGASRPASLNAWDEYGNAVPWSELSSTWMLWDRQHHIILPQPCSLRPVCYPHHTAMPYMSILATVYWAQGKLRGTEDNKFTYTKANRKRANQYLEFLELLTVKGRMVGRPGAVRTLVRGDVAKMLRHAPDLCAVSAEECQQLVWGFGMESRINPAVVGMVRDLSRDTFTTRYLTTKKWRVT